MKYLSKTNTILDLCKNKTVLHLRAVGFTDLEPSDRLKNFPNTLHYKLMKISEVIGIDYSKSVIELLKLNGINNIIFGDVEKLNDIPLRKEFDVIVIGDLIEHLANPGLLLSGIHRFCKENTRIIITTPNAFGILNFIRFLFGRFNEGNEHVISFNQFNLINLIKRFGYEIESINTCHQDTAKNYRLLFKVIKIIFNIFPKIGGTLFLVVKPKSNAF